MQVFQIFVIVLDIYYLILYRKMMYAYMGEVIKLKMII